MKEPLPQQDPNIRKRNFSEVALGYTKDQAIKEAKRCIQCKNPLCVKGCPVNIDIPAFIKLIALDNPKEALKKLKEKNNLPAVCGRVCPQEDQCEKMCILGKKGTAVGIGYLERYAADFGKSDEQTVIQANPDALKIAVVGSGPSGLTCAADLQKMGYKVSVFESLHKAGGVLSYGIPEFRLPKKTVQDEVDYIKSLGVEFNYNMLIGNIYSLKDLFDEGFKAIYIGAGAGLPKYMNIPGENLNGVYSANEFLIRVNLMKAYLFPEYLTPIKIGKKAVIVGGGNVAFDSARSALRLGADEVTVLYRRSRTEMPAREEEIIRAEEEGIKFMILSAPLKIKGDDIGYAKEIQCIKMELGEPDESGRGKFFPIKDSEFIIPADLIISAIGQSPNPLLTKATPDLKIEKWGGIIVNLETGETSIKGVFAGGDIVSGADTVISAMGAGKRAANSIDSYVKSLAISVK